VNDTFGYAFVADAPTFSALVLSREGALLSDDGARVLFNTLEGEKAMRILRDTFGTSCAYTVPGRDWDRADFASAKTLFNIAPSSTLPAYQSDIERTSMFRWGVAPLPRNGPDPITPLDGPGWTILKTTPDRQLAAWLFVRWFAESNQTQRWTLANYTLPVRRSAIKTLLETPDLNPNLEQVLKMAAYGQPEPSIAKWDAVRKIVVDTMRAVAGGMDPKESLDQAEAAANAALQGGPP
jgi:ABC-type glycerol-3-phosphate transport system substrate-binding protein